MASSVEIEHDVARISSEPEAEVNVPIYLSLGPVYGDDADIAMKRYERLASEFGKIYGHEPQVFARAPGRVNLIGEHIDYEGYPVLPMAIRQDTIVAIRRVDHDQSDGAQRLLKVANVNAEKYPAAEYVADPSQEVDLENHKWSHYFLCGYKGVFDHMHSKGIQGSKNCTLEVLIDGIVPTGAGLSSSAALVCSSAIAVMAVFGLTFPKSEVAEFTCKCERYIGTQSGGMDQAISVMALPGVAKLIEFEPVVAHDVKLPAGGTFVIANSLTVSNKAETAATNYNNRVVECRLAAMVLAVRTGELPPKQAVDQISMLSDVMSIWDAAKEEGGELIAGIVAAVGKYLHDEPYTAEEIEGILGTSLEHVFRGSPTTLAVLNQAKEFKLCQRAQHVYSEALRVRAFREAAASAQSGAANGEEVLATLGALMDDSHQSCSQLYECSCPELEELVGVARANGALGARLTGAGWGGCTVSLVRDGAVEPFIQALKDKFFKARVEMGLVKEDSLEAVVFASKPAAGAAIFRM